MSTLVENAPLILGGVAVITSFIALYIEKKINLDQKSERNQITGLDASTISNVLNPEQAAKGMQDLVNYARSIKPDYIVGINRGGVLVGAYISLAIGLKSKFFLKCGVTTLKNKEVEVDCDFDSLEGTVLIVDSIIRSGKTMNAAVEEIRKVGTNIRNLYSAAIVCSINQDGSPSSDKIDFYSFSTFDKNLLLPWTHEYPISKENRADHIKEEFISVKTENILELSCEVYTVIDAKP